MKLFFFLLATTGMVFASLGDCVILLGFSVNRDYIAENLCEKRNEKGNTCRGHCYLCKQLNHDELSPRHLAPPTLKKGGDFNLFEGTRDGFSRRRPPSLVRQNHRTTPVPEPPSRDIDHPPELSAS